MTPSGNGHVSGILYPPLELKDKVWEDCAAVGKEGGSADACPILFFCFESLSGPLGSAFFPCSKEILYVYLSETQMGLHGWNVDLSGSSYGG